MVYDLVGVLAFIDFGVGKLVELINLRKENAASKQA